MAEAKTDNHRTENLNDEPAKGGLKPAEKKPHTSGDSLKKQGDKLEHAVGEAAKGKNS